MDYITHYVDAWMVHPFLAVPKSRRMLMSWTNIALYLWDTAFHEARLNALVSRKEDASAELLSRARFIFDRIPKEVVPRELLPKLEATSTEMKFKELNSSLQAYAQGANQLRQYTFSGIFADEIAFWEQAEEVYKAAIPTLSKANDSVKGMGGRFTAVSSASPGFFQRLVFDAIDKTNQTQLPEDTQYQVERPINGLRTWKNQKTDSSYSNSISTLTQERHPTPTKIN
ncbi:MAG: hypothetical protein HC842_02230 [Cytophagales bacterium]|nr:hypothetical protein [Cytophagales bacterium]